jgi:hypothetical protein
MKRLLYIVSLLFTVGTVKTADQQPGFLKRSLGDMGTAIGNSRFGRYFTPRTVPTESAPERDFSRYFAAEPDYMAPGVKEDMGSVRERIGTGLRSFYNRNFVVPREQRREQRMEQLRETMAGSYQPILPTTEEMVSRPVEEAQFPVIMPPVTVDITQGPDVFPMTIPGRTPEFSGIPEMPMVQPIAPVSPAISAEINKTANEPIVVPPTVTRPSRFRNALDTSWRYTERAVGLPFRSVKWLYNSLSFNIRDVPSGIKSKFNAWKEAITSRVPSYEGMRAAAARGVDLFNEYTAWLQSSRPARGIGWAARGTARGVGNVLGWSVNELNPRGVTLPRWLGGTNPVEE